MNWRVFFAVLLGVPALTALIKAIGDCIAYAFGHLTAFYALSAMMLLVMAAILGWACSPRRDRGGV